MAKERDNQEQSGTSGKEYEPRPAPPMRYTSTVDLRGTSGRERRNRLDRHNA